MTILSARRRVEPGVCISWLVVTMVIALFALILGELVLKGIGQLSFSFLLDAPSDVGRAGGIGPILVSTGALVAVALLAAVPLASLCALWLYLGAGRTARRSRAALERSLEVLAAVPSVVFGLFGQVLFGEVLGLGYSLLTGGLTLAVMMMPLLIGAIYETLRALPSTLYAGALALGLTPAQAARRVLLQAAWPGVLLGVLMGLGRALAETAALLFTSGYVDKMPRSLLDSGRAISVHIYELAMNVAGGNKNAYGAAALLVMTLLVLHSVAAVALWWVRRKRLSYGG